MFQWSDGFHAFTVAARSRPKALEAWGVSQDLFATGLAKQIDEGPDFDAALQQPGGVVARGLAVDVGRARSRPAAPSNGKARRKLKAAQVALETWAVQAEAEQAELEARIVALDRERTTMTRRHDAERHRLQATITAAREQAGKTEP